MPSEPVDVMAALPPWPSVFDPDYEAKLAKRAERTEAALDRTLEMLDAELVKGDSEIALGDQLVYIAHAELARLAAGEPSDA